MRCKPFFHLFLLSVLFFEPLGHALGQDIQNGSGRMMFTVTRNYHPLPPQENVKIVLDWSELMRRVPSIQSGGLIVKDANFGTTVIGELKDSNSDGMVDQVAFDFTFTSGEPVYAFSVEPANGLPMVSAGEVSPDSRWQVTYLTSSEDWIRIGHEIKSWPDKIIESTMAFYVDPVQMAIYAPRQWNYEYGFFLNAALVRWAETRNPDYLKYIKKWADHFIDSHGAIDTRQYRVEEYKLDDILPGRLFISLHEITQQAKYKNAAAQLASQLLYQPKTGDGGYWHKQIYPFQMWLDGIYMADIFSVQYALAFNEPKFFNEAIYQIKLIAEHTTDPVTGLMYHGWDESGNKVWANPDTGTSPEFWSRAIGWYLMALVECLDYIPENHPKRNDVIAILKSLCARVSKFQDKESNLWYQIINKGQEPSNWIETSASAMFVYSLAKAQRKGFIERKYYEVAKKGFDSLIKNYVYFDDTGKLYLDQTVKIGTLNIKNSKGDYDYYVTTERRINDYKGLSALLYASLAMD